MVDKIDPAKLNESLKNQLDVCAGFIRAVNFLGDFIIVRFTSYPKRKIQDMQVALAEKLSVITEMEFEFFKLKGREWWFRRSG
jgi:hypothetical protein